MTQNPQDQFVSDTVREEILVGLKGQPDAEAKTEDRTASQKAEIPKTKSTKSELQFSH